MQRILGCLLGGMLLSACGSAVGVGGNEGALVSTTVTRNATDARIREAAVSVFTRDGFSRAGDATGSVSFVKQGGRSAEVAWKTLGNDNPVMIRPTVRWRLLGGGEAKLMCDVEITQASTAYGETARQPLLAGKSAYSGLLRQVKSRVESAAGE